MKKSKFIEPQIIRANKENEAGRNTKYVSRVLGISTVKFYKWRKYSGIDVSDLKQLKELQVENAKLKNMYAEQALQLEMAKEVISKKW